MKYLSFVVPSYNASAYLNKCVESLAIGGDDVEIIIVNDGSKDNTLEIANELKVKHPNNVIVIDKENGGHGSTINAALKVATGLYFKCVDADDWVDPKAYMELLSKIKEHYANNEVVDMYICNFMYENLSENKQCLDTHKKRFPVGKICTFEEVKKFPVGEFLMMHNVINRLEILKKANVEMPEHTFYIDNLYLYLPLYYTNTLCYLDIDFYRYYVGRPNQSVTLENMTKNYAMQIRVIREMSLRYTYDELKSLSRKKRNFIIHELVIIHHLTLFYIVAGLNKQRKEEYANFMKEFKEKNRKLYMKVRYRTSFAFPMILIPPLRKFAIMAGYKCIVRRTHWN